ncbi:glycosyltransferase [Paracoccus sp. KCTC 42845]|uniref:Glycosyltransferase n=1 Tax=Paracoccus aerius TaxID=1915382 RepID=A0ABS1SAH1_9RHOB|nr:glycosyltransferase [Paracoccus aerius]
MSAISDHALVVHVWHLDVLDDLVEAAANLPETTDQFVTIPNIFEAAQREQVALAFPRAQLLPIENIGQDVGALFQLMKQVDLGRYNFICKIHTKKGPNMPNEWRRALLDGVLGSQRQVKHIIDRFRTDPQVMLAGARQLYVHGPSYLEPNAEGVEKAFGEMIGDFDFRTEDWGFIAGTCFWIRTSILEEMAACSMDFHPAAYVTDGAPAHAAERMFGLGVAVRSGKMLLQDLRFSRRLPDEEHGFPNDLPRKWLRLAQVLTPLAVNMFIKPYRAPVEADALAKVSDVRRRVAVFASYSADGILPPQVIPYLEGLKPLTAGIVVVCDNDLLPSELEKLSGLAVHVITGRHGEYDFGSYKRGVAWAREAGLLDQADDLILCNDSCYGPVQSFAPMFATMEGKGLDFWGATDSHEFSYHLQSYFVVLTRRVFTSAAFMTFINGVTKQDNVQKVIINYEIGLTKILLEEGFAAAALIPNYLAGLHKKDPTYDNITLFPLYALERGLPLLKVKVMRNASMNTDGASRVLSWLRNNDEKLYKNINYDIEISRFNDAEDVKFTVIMPTFNRRWCISNAIASVMAQTHSNFELIIVDDASNDGTDYEVMNDFKDQIKQGKIRYLKLPTNVGVSRARNIGLSHADSPWIAYADSDNTMRPYFLSMMANCIANHPEKDALYGRMININEGSIIGRPFEQGDLIRGNFIDLGVFCHRRSIATKLGGFDDSLKRLVDWDLCIRYTRHQAPAYINRILLDYVDEERQDRISVRESYLKADVQVRHKHSPKPTVTSVILGYNHEDFIVEAIESALEQRGDFHHEILLADDGSTDGTARIMSRYVEKYPMKIRSITRGGNFGVSENYRHCFREAQGQFISVLEGDDYWTDPEKNIKQVTFLRDHLDAAMVLSRIELYDMKKNSRRLLKRQEGLPSMLSAADFARNEHLNLIVNLSCCMFRSDIMKRLPSTLYEPRLSEIAIAFYLDRIGGIGFLPQVMSTYRMNEKSVWTGADRTSQHQQAIDVRQCALRVARPIYRAIIQEHIDRRKDLLAAELIKVAA